MSSSAHTCSTEEKPNVLFIFGDGRHGRSMVKSLCKCNEEKERIYCCLTVVVDKSFEKEMEDIKSKTCKIRSIDMRKQKENPAELNEIMKEHRYDWIIMLPVGDTFTPQCVMGTLDLWKKNRGKNVMMLSKAQCDQSQKESMKMLCEAEKSVREHFPESNVIIRGQFLFNDLDFFVEDVQKKKCWRLPLGDGAFSPIRMKEIAMCVGFITRRKNIDDKFKGQVFTITNKEKVNGPVLAEMSRTALNEDIKYENISLEEASEIMKRCQHGGGSSSGAGGLINRLLASSGKQRDMRRHLLSNTERDIIVACFELVQQGKYDFVTEHFHQITGMEPMSVEEYLRKHEDNFK